MSVYFRKDNRKWYVDIYHNGQRIRRKTAARSKAEAKEIQRTIEADLMRGDYRLVNKKRTVPFSGLCNRYLEYAKANKAGTTYQRDTTSIGSLKKTFGNIQISKITGVPLLS